MAWIRSASAAVAVIRLVLAIAVAASLAVSACGGGACACPAGVGLRTVAVPAAQASPITSATTNSPCSILMMDSTSVQVASPSAMTCHVTVQLENGDSYGFSVQFLETRIGGDCTCNTAVAVDASAPELIDAGTGD